jgi:hypothetical protein
VRRPGPIVAAVAVLAAALTSCATPTSGQAVPGDAPGSTSRPGAAPGTRPTSRPQVSPLAGLDPCALLTASGKAKLGITTEGEHRDILASRGCQWRVRLPQATYLFTVGLLDKAGIEKIPSEVAVEKIPNIGDHQAVLGKGAGGTTGCGVSLGITDSSRVDTQVVAGTDVDKACELVMQLARLVEPELP